MKWIGQYIQDFITRFRSDVYLEDISTGTIASGGNLGLDSNNKIVKAASSVSYGDDDKIILGDGNDGEIYVSSDDLYIRNVTTDKDVIFQSDDSSGGEETYFFLDGSSSGAGSPKTVWPDGSTIALGSGNDHVSFHDGSDTYHLITTGNVEWQNFDDGEDYIFKTLDGASMNTMLTISKRGLAVGSGKHIITVDQVIRFADSGDNTVIVELADVKIPAKAIITNVAAIVNTLSNLATHEVNIQMSATSGTAADSAISSGTELLGAGAAVTESTDSTSASDISLGTSADDLKDVWVLGQVRNPIRNGTSDQYLYVCNAGTGNGTTNSTVGTLTIIVEYYGID